MSETRDILKVTLQEMRKQDNGEYHQLFSHSFDVQVCLLETRNIVNLLFREDEANCGWYIVKAIGELERHGIRTCVQVDGERPVAVMFDDGKDKLAFTAKDVTWKPKQEDRR